jgi:hypothetical protein
VSPKKLEQSHILTVDESMEEEAYIEYDRDIAMIAAQTMIKINQMTMDQGANFAQQYIVQRGLKKFGDKGKQAASKEMDQLHKRNCFTPMDIFKLSAPEKKKAQEALMFLMEKRDGTIKGRMVYNGKPTREWLSKEGAASPTASLESIMLTAIVDAKEKRDVMSANTPNAFIQTAMPPTKRGQDRVIIKITGVLVDLLVSMAPETYGPYVVFEDGKKTLYVQVL